MSLSHLIVTILAAMAIGTIIAKLKVMKVVYGFAAVTVVTVVTVVAVISGINSELQAIVTVGIGTGTGIGTVVIGTIFGHTTHTR